jgi:hypothetical protein
MKVFISVIILFLSSTTCNAQKKFTGYIITKDGDTLKGLIGKAREIDSGQFCSFYDSATQIKVDLQFENVLGYGYTENDKQNYYEKIKLERNPFTNEAFLKNILKGKIAVFEYQYTTGNFNNSYTKTVYYLKKETGDISTLTFGGVLSDNKTVLKYALADSDCTVEKVKGIISKKKAIELIETYNKCSVEANK